MSDETCENCMWNACGICTNFESDYFKDIVDSDQNCMEWEGN